MSRSKLASLFAFVAVVALFHVASADTPSPGDPGTGWQGVGTATTSVESSASGVTIRIAVAAVTPGQPDTGATTNIGDSSTSGGGDWDCTAYPMNLGHAILPWFERERVNHPGELPWTVNCANGYFDVVWLPVDIDSSAVEVMVETGAPAADPLLLVAELLDEIPVPDIQIGLNPEVGLVAVPSWFWIDGYDGTPIVQSASLADVTVEVEITPTAYHWRFGDGRELATTSAGLAYPAVSDINHTYEQSSLVAGGTYAVSVELTFDVRFRVVGEGWQDLDPITRSFETAYPVRQMQSVLTGN